MVVLWEARGLYGTEIGPERGASSAYLEAVSKSLASNATANLTLIEAGEGPGLLAFRRYVAFESSLYPIAVL